MTLRQKILKLVYPLFIFYKKLQSPKALQNGGLVQPIVSFYNLFVELNDGSKLSFKFFKGKKVLLVNTASDCGYTAQYKELQQLQERFSRQLHIIGFPSNDFKRQEKGDDKTIAEFCSRYYDISFPLARKAHVLKSELQQDVFKWLTTKELNGWNNQQPSWNFSKYLIDENGMLTHYFDPAVSPLGKKIIRALQKD